VYPNGCKQKKMHREQLFRNAIGENSRRIFRICSYFFYNWDDRNDAYQETLIRIWENLHSFKGNSLLSTWIYRVTVNTCLSHIRSEKRRINLIESTSSPEVFLVAEPGGNEDACNEENKIIFLQQFMMNLSMADRTLVSLYLEDLSTKEMAEITGISEANVRVRMHRIKNRIKNEWEETQHGTG
jgi:RNA polymerase sigma-70 factor (ECF subfamily)